MELNIPAWEDAGNCVPRAIALERAGHLLLEEGRETVTGYLHRILQPSDGSHKSHRNTRRQVNLCITSNGGIDVNQLRRLRLKMRGTPAKKRPSVLRSRIARLVRDAKRRQREEEKLNEVKRRLAYHRQMRPIHS